MSDTLADLIAAALHHEASKGFRGTPTPWELLPQGARDSWYPRVDAILTALDEAGYTIVKRDAIAAALAYGDEFRTIPAAVARHKLRTAAGMPTKRQRQQTPTTPNTVRMADW